MKGFTKDKKFHPIKPYQKGIRKKRISGQVTDANVGVKINQSRHNEGLRLKRFLTENDIDRLSDLQLNAILKEIEKKWSVNESTGGFEGDGFSIIYTNKEDPNYTFELHPLTDTVEAEPPEHPEDEEFNSWYWFPAKNQKGIPNSPSVMSETGGYTRKDAIREFRKEFILYDQEFSS